MLNDNEYTEFEGRKYLNPQIALDESNSFIDNLRNTQKLNNQQIQTQTYNLGSALPSHQGGLGTGLNANSYFTSRYQVPQTNAAISDLRATAQATALNQVLQNEQEKWKKRYNDAYRAQQRSAYNKANSGGGLSGITNGGVDQTDPTGQASYQWGDGKPVTYSSDIGTRAGWGEWNDLFTGKYNFSLPGGVELELGGNDEELQYGSNGVYYIHNKRTGVYSPVIIEQGATSGNNSKDGGESRWWIK